MSYKKACDNRQRWSSVSNKYKKEKMIATPNYVHLNFNDNLSDVEKYLISILSTCLHCKATELYTKKHVLKKFKTNPKFHVVYSIIKNTKCKYCNELKNKITVNTCEAKDNEETTRFNQEIRKKLLQEKQRINRNELNQKTNNSNSSNDKEIIIKKKKKKRIHLLFLLA